MSQTTKEGNKRTIFLFIDNIDVFSDNIQLNEILDLVRGVYIDFIGTICLRLDVNIKMTITMRDTTLFKNKQFLPEHYRDYADGRFWQFDVTRWVDKPSIINKRLFLINSSSIGFVEKSAKDSIEIIGQISNDASTSSVLLPLFNNNYRRVITAINSIVFTKTTHLKECVSLLNSNKKCYRNGARGIILNLLLSWISEDDNIYFKELF